MFNLIFSLVFFVAAALAALFGFLRAKKAKWQLCSMRLATDLIAGIAAILLSVIVAQAISGVALDLILDVASGEVAELLSAEAISDSAEAIVGMILAPIFYLLLFAIIKPLLAIANKPVARLLVGLFEKKDKENDGEKAEETSVSYNECESYADYARRKKAERRGTLANDRITVPSAVLGAVSGFMLFYFLTIPSVCGLALVGDAAGDALRDADFEYSEAACDVADGFAYNAGATLMRFTGGKAAYRYMTSYDVAGHKATLETELDFISTAAGAVMAVSHTPENYDGEKAEASLTSAADRFSRTTIIPSILPELLKNATDAWEAGEEYMGLPKLSLGDSFEPVSDTLLDILGNEDFDTVKKDTAAILKVFGIIIGDNHPSTIKDNPLDIVKNEKTSTEIFKLLYASDRLYELIPAFSECGINLICTTLEMHDDLAPLYDKMIIDLETEIAITIANNRTNTLAQTEPSALTTSLTAVIKDVMGRYGIEISDDSAAILASAAADGYGITDTLKQFEITVLDVEGNASIIVLDNVDTYVQHTQFVSASEIEIHKDKPADTAKEAEALAHTFAIVLELATKLEDTELSMNTIVVDLGRLLDSFEHTHTFGHDSTRNLLICMLQSDKVHDTLKVSVINMTDVIYHICDSAETDSYTLLLQNLSRALDIINAASVGDRADEAIHDLIVDLTPATSTTIQQIATPSTMINYGVPEQSAAASADLVADVFTSLSDAKENNTMSEEEYEEEAQAVSDLLAIAVSAANNKTADKTFGENSATGVTAEEFIERLTASEVVSQTLVDTVYNDDGSIVVDPLNSERSIDDEEKAELLTAANNHLAGLSEEESATTQQQLIAAAALLNINVQVVDGALVELPAGIIA